MAAGTGNKALRKMNARNNRKTSRSFREMEVCVHKAGYPTEDSASGALLAILTKGNTAVRPTRSYHCGLCGEWHLISKG